MCQAPRYYSKCSHLACLYGLTLLFFIPYYLSSGCKYLHNFSVQSYTIGIYFKHFALFKGDFSNFSSFFHHSRTKFNTC